jgi:hypothetical protein
MPYTHLTERDYDQQLREMGNYLWDLEQAADVASAQGLPEDVQSIEARIRGLGERAAGFAGVEGSHGLLAMYVAGLAYRMVREWAAAAGWFEQVVKAQRKRRSAAPSPWTLTTPVTGHWQRRSGAPQTTAAVFDGRVGKAGASG